MARKGSKAELLAEIERLNARAREHYDERIADKREPEVAGFKIVGSANLSRVEEYRDRRYKISNHGRSEYNRWRGTWCYYVYIPEHSLDADQFQKFWLPVDRMQERSSGVASPTYDYWKPLWSDADWHGGVTWYAKEGGIDGAPRCAEIGCDFAHSWDADAGYHYDFGYVERECKRTIDALHNLYPFRAKCGYSGAWVLPSEIVEHDGRRYAPAGLASMLESQARWAKERSNTQETP